MRKHRAALHLTYYEDSGAVSAYVEFENEHGRWELLSDDTSHSWRVALGQFIELQEWLRATMAGGSSSSSDTR